MSIDDEANYTVHLVQTLEDDVYVTRGDSLEGIDGAGAIGPPYRHHTEGSEGQKGGTGTYVLQSDEKAEGKLPEYVALKALKLYPTQVTHL